MWTSPEEARSDLFLSGAAYLFGPLLIGLLINLLLLDRITGVAQLLMIAVPFVTTALVPLLLIRYRKEQLRRDYGFGGGASALAEGVLLSLPIAVGGILAVVLAGGGPLDALPLSTPGEVVLLLRRLVFWIGLPFLLLYATVKARDAFPSFPQRLGEVVQQIGRIVALVAAVSLVLLQLVGVNYRVLLVLAGVAGAVVLGFVRYAKGPRTTGRSTVLAPVVLAALGPFVLTLRAAVLLEGLFNAALFAAVGLLVAEIVEGARPAEVVLGLGFGIATLTSLGGFLA